MKRKLVVSLLAFVLAPTMTFTQASASVTRAQVRDELVQLQRAGYRGDTDASYPNKLLEAEDRLSGRSVPTSETGKKARAGRSTQPSKPAITDTTEIPGFRPLYSGS